MQEIYEKIVLDGSNIIHDDTGIEMKSDDGERLIQIRPERLLAAINHCESLGWTAIACLKEGTYTWAKSNADAETVGDVDLLDELIQDGKVITIPAKEDDIYFIDYALKVNAMIVTHDSFRDKKDDQGNVIKRERSLYPNRDWTDIDRRTLRDFRFVKDQFILPSLTQKGPSLPLTEKSTITLDQIYAEIMELQSMVRKIQHAELRKQIESAKNNKNMDRSIASSITEQMLSNGKKVQPNVLQQEIARVLLKLPKNQSKWKQGWNKNLKKKLGYSSFNDWIMSISKKKITFNKKKGLLHY